MDELQLKPEHLRERAYEAEHAHSDRYPELDLFSESAAERSAARRGSEAAEREALRVSLRFLPANEEDRAAEVGVKAEAEGLFAKPLQADICTHRASSPEGVTATVALCLFFALLGFGLTLRTKLWLRRKQKELRRKALSGSKTKHSKG